MPLIVQSHDSLAFIDSEPRPESRAAALRLVQSELGPDHATTLHPSIPVLQAPKFSTLVQQELDRVAQGIPREGSVDLSRYEELEAPSSSNPSDLKTLEAWRDTLRRAYTSSDYLTGRLVNLGLLETFGKKAWLISNDELGEISKRLEKELAERRQQLEELQQARRSAQEGIKGELEAMDKSWRMNLGRLIETEIAAEKLRKAMLEVRRSRMT